MSEDRLVLDTKKSLYESFKIEIDGQVYQCIKMTRAILTEVNKLDEKIVPNNNEALYKAVQLLFNVPVKILDELDNREVEDIYLYAKRKFVEIEKERLNLITNTIGNVLDKKGKQVNRTIPKNRKRPGNKA